MKFSEVLSGNFSNRSEARFLLFAVTPTYPMWGRFVPSIVDRDSSWIVLCNLVCDGLLDIGDAQEAIIKDWIAAYHLYNE
jgi:hypothetical protein